MPVPDEPLVLTLRRLYREHPEAKELFEKALKKRQYESYQTTIATLQRELKLDGSEAVRLARELCAAGCGTFRAGRDGSKPRIEWAHGLKQLSQVATGVSDTFNVPDQSMIYDAQPPDPKASSDWITYPLPFRDRTVTLALPRDLTVGEAEWLSNFVRALPQGTS